MTLCGTEIEDPREGLSKRDYREYREGVRTTVKEMWVYSYRDEGPAKVMWRYPVTMTNRGVCTFDGRQVKDEKEKKTISDLFSSLNLV